MPILLALVFGIIEFGFAINRWAMVNNAAREGVREASLSATEFEVRQAVNDSITGDQLEPTVVQLTCTRANGTGCANWNAGMESGGTAVVTVTYRTNWLTPLGAMFADDLRISKQARMRIE